jgi:hypothetical protein
MKNIKILFASLAVVAVVGSSLAFKAARFSSIYVWQKVSSTSCPLKAGQFDLNGSVQLTNVFTSTTSTVVVPVSLCTSTIHVNQE